MRRYQLLWVVILLLSSPVSFVLCDGHGDNWETVSTGGNVNRTENDRMPLKSPCERSYPIRCSLPLHGATNSSSVAVLGRCQTPTSPFHCLQPTEAKPVDHDEQMQLKPVSHDGMIQSKPINRERRYPLKQVNNDNTSRKPVNDDGQRRRKPVNLDAPTNRDGEGALKPVNRDGKRQLIQDQIDLWRRSQHHQPLHRRQRLRPVVNPDFRKRRRGTGVPHDWQLCPYSMDKVRCFEDYMVLYLHLLTDRSQPKRDRKTNLSKMNSSRLR